MLIRAAEESFQKGVEALAQGKSLEALALFESAIAIERQFGGERAQPRYVSYYGLCLVLQNRKLVDALALCREAVEAEFFNPDLYCNLVRVLVAAGRRAEAYGVALRGLRWESRHSGLQRELRSLGSRRKPVIRFLSRNNPINVFLGRMTYQPQHHPVRRAAAA